MAVIALGLTVFGHSLPVTAVLLAAWGLVAHRGAGGVVDRGWPRTLPDDAEAGGGLMVAVVQLASRSAPPSAACCSTAPATGPRSA